MVRRLLHFTLYITSYTLFEILLDRSRENGPRYYPRPNRLPLPFQANWYPLAGGFQTWNNGNVEMHLNFICI